MGRYVTYHDMNMSPPPFSFALDCTASARRTYSGRYLDHSRTYALHTLAPAALHSRQSIEGIRCGPGGARA